MTDRAVERDARRRVLRTLAKEIGHEFEELGHLDRALTHASTGNDGKQNYERLEFLGDAILSFLVAEALFRREPEIPEGRLTEARAALVSRAPLARIARQLSLVTWLDAGKGLREGERNSERILADLAEAVLGAVYLDGGIRAARRFVKRFVLAEQTDVLPSPDPATDSKTRLLHLCQRHRLGQPKYRVTRTTGLQHEQEFTVEVRIDDGRAAEGSGRNKRSAEKHAAAQLLADLQAGRGQAQDT